MRYAATGRHLTHAAGLEAASKSALIGVAKATMYPSFSLAGEFGLTSSNEGDNSLADIFNWESRALKAGAGFVFPIFNFFFEVSSD